MKYNENHHNSLIIRTITHYILHENLKRNQLIPVKNALDNLKLEAEAKSQVKFWTEFRNKVIALPDYENYVNLRQEWRSALEAIKNRIIEFKGSLADKQEKIHCESILFNKGELKLLKRFKLLAEAYGQIKKHKWDLAIFGVCACLFIIAFMPIFQEIAPEVNIPISRESNNHLSIRNKGTTYPNSTLSISVTYIEFESQEFELFVTISEKKSSQLSIILYTEHLSIGQNYYKSESSNNYLDYPVFLEGSYTTKVQFSPLNSYYLYIRFDNLDLAVNASEWENIEFIAENWGSYWNIDLIEELLHDHWSEEALEGTLLLFLMIDKQFIPTLIEAIFPLINFAFLPLLYWKTNICFKGNPSENEITNSRKFRLDSSKWLFGFSLLYNLPWLTELTKKPSSIMMSLSVATLFLTVVFYLTSDYNEEGVERQVNRSFAILALTILATFVLLSFIPIWYIF